MGSRIAQLSIQSMHRRSIHAGCEVLHLITSSEAGSARNSHIASPALLNLYGFFGLEVEQIRADFQFAFVTRTTPTFLKPRSSTLESALEATTMVVTISLCFRWDLVFGAFDWFLVASVEQPAISEHLAIFHNSFPLNNRGHLIRV